MKTTKDFSDEIEEQEEQYYKDKMYILAERNHQEMLIWQEIEQNEQKPSIILGKGRKSRKFETHGKVRTTSKLPHFLKTFQHKCRSI